MPLSASYIIYELAASWTRVGLSIVNNLNCLCVSLPSISPQRDKKKLSILRLGAINSCKAKKTFRGVAN